MTHVTPAPNTLPDAAVHKRDVVRTVVARKGRDLWPSRKLVLKPSWPSTPTHTCSDMPAAMLANKGHDTRALQAYLGHRNIQHTVRYTELSPTHSGISAGEAHAFSSNSVLARVDQYVELAPLDFVFKFVGTVGGVEARQEAPMKTCPDCNGDGVVEKGTDDEQRCPTCGGSGFVADDDTDNEEVIKTDACR